jgi:hypothetical protein
MKRALRYVEAGADCILIHSKANKRILCHAPHPRRSHRTHDTRV